MRTQSQKNILDYNIKRKRPSTPKAVYNFNQFQNKDMELDDGLLKLPIEQKNPQNGPN